MSSTAATTPPSTESELRAKIAGLGDGLRLQAARAEAASKELEAFAHSVSHDLRAPLRGITSFTRVLLEDHAEKLDAEGKRTLHLIRDEARRMSEHIEGMLIFSRAGRERLEASEIDMTELARSAFQALAELQATPLAAFEVKPLPRASGDRRIVRQVFGNLLGNAVKFAARQPAAQIEVTGWSDEGGSTYCVADNGVGFDQRYAHKLFGVFQRLHSQEEFEGAGVGLAVVQRIVHRHGGRTWAEGKSGGGAKFYFTLPRGSEIPT